MRKSKSSDQMKKKVQVKVIKRQNIPINKNSRLSAQFNEFKQQSVKVPFKRKQLIHDSLCQHQNKTHNAAIFDAFALIEQTERIVKQGAKEDQGTRTIVKNYERYPYYCYGNVVAIYEGEISGQKKIEKSDGIAAIIGKELMMTATHVVPLYLKGLRLKRIKVYFRYTSISLLVKEVIRHPQYQHLLQKTMTPFDMAVLVMQPNSDFIYPQKVLSINWNYSLQDYTSKEYKFLTFIKQSDKLFELRQANHQIILVDQWKILYKNTTDKGDSGSLILKWDRELGKYYVVGMHIGEYGKYNYGILFTTKSYSPKDIFSQMIEQNLRIEHQQQIRQISSQSQASTIQSNKQPYATQIVQQLYQTGNYYPSTEKYIESLIEEKNKLEEQKTKFKQQIKNKGSLVKQHQLMLQNLQNRFIKKQSDSNPMKTQIKQYRQENQKQFYDNIETPKKRQQHENKQSQLPSQKVKVNLNNNLTKEVKTKTSKEYKPKQQKGKQSKGKSRKQKKQQNCFVIIYRMFTNWINRPSRSISTQDQPSTEILQN